MNDGSSEHADPDGLPPTPDAPPAPIAAPQRIASIDVLRGVALLGILVMNLPSFALLPWTFFNPQLDGGFTGWNRIVWLLGHFLVEFKMMAIFSMLFGAGIIIFTTRASSRGRSPVALTLRRLGILLIVGLLHAYLLWEGDILFTYALCGMLVLPLRKLSARRLALIGACIILVVAPINHGLGRVFEASRERAEAAQLELNDGAELTPARRDAIGDWAELRSGFDPDEEQIEERRLAVGGSYADLFRARAYDSFFMQTFVFVTWSLWRVAGLMLLGMALLKSDWLNASRPIRHYLALLLGGYAIGFPLILHGVQRMTANEFDFVALYLGDWNWNYVGSVFVALGHIALVMLLVKLRALGPLESALAAVGRTAFSNYLLQTLICAIIFYGWGFGFAGSFDRVQLTGFVLAIWVFQLIASTLWLRRFDYGPMEWLWRCATYGRAGLVRPS